jgi:hypothetical protein
VFPVGPGFRFQYEVGIQKLGGARPQWRIRFTRLSPALRSSTNRARLRLPWAIAQGRRRAGAFRSAARQSWLSSNSAAEIQLAD